MKDSGNLEAKIEVIRLIRKYDRVETTIIGAADEKDTKVMHELDQDIPKFFSLQMWIKLYSYYLLGILPFVSIYPQVLSGPYLTREYRKMKERDFKNNKVAYYSGLYFMIAFNKYGDPFLEHL